VTDVTVATPLCRPQVVAVAELANVAGLDAATDIVLVALQPALFTVTVYVPDARPVMLAAVLLLLHVYVGLLGLPTAMDAAPLLSPQVVAVDEGVNAGALDAVTVTLDVEAHPWTSFTVTVYVPAARPVIAESVAALLHRYVNGAVPPDGMT
jgi:hypothetical protein